MSTIIDGDYPNEYPAGTEFDYSVWTPGTNVTLSNVPWDATYKDIVRFPTGQAGLNAYIDASEITNYQVGQASYHKIHATVRLPIPFGAANRFNYLRAFNRAQPVNAPVGGADTNVTFFYFILDVRHIAANTTEFVLQLDVFQTYGYTARIGACYIERGHIGIANSKQMDNYGRAFLTVPEGIDTGGEMMTIAKRRTAVMGPDWFEGYDILIAMTAKLDGDHGTVDDPQLESAGGSLFQGLPSGANYYVFPGAAGFLFFMKAFEAKPWVTASIISITAIPKITRYFPDFEYAGGWESGVPTTPPPFPGKTLTHAIFPNWRESAEIINNIPERYRHLKKFLTYPYMTVEATTWTGTPITMKPESWQDANAAFIERSALVPPGQRIAFAPQRYNSKTNAPVENRPPLRPIYPAPGQGDDNGEFLDLVTVIANFPTMALVNNSAILAMAAQAHGMAYQAQSADWSQQRALRGNEVSYDNARTGNSQALTQNRISGAADVANTALGIDTAGKQAIVGAAGSILGGIGGGAPGIIGGVGAAAMGGLQYAIQSDYQTQALGIRRDAANESTNAGFASSSLINNRNKSLADYSANGDYENAIAGMNAKTQDMKLTQPTTVGQTGGEAFNLIHDNVELNVRWKMISENAMQVIGEYWLRYGYAVRKYVTAIPTSLMTMENFTYWKLSETYIVNAPIPEGFKQTLRGIFEKGVTVYKDPARIGTTDIGDNAPLGGISL